MEYTVKQLSQLAGVSGRTLRYYDSIGLLSPLRTTEAGYRIYGEHEVDLLQQILFFRELGLPLDEIRALIYRPDFDAQKALEHHLKELKQRRSRLDKMIATVEKTIQHQKGECIMSNQEKFEAFKEGLIKENEAKYGNEIREAYGEEAVAQSNAKRRGMSEETYQEMQAVEAELAEVLRAGGDPCGPNGERAARLHKQWLMYSWHEYSAEAHVGLAEMYLQDERFAAYYERMAEDGSQFLHDAVAHFCGNSLL